MDPITKLLLAGRTAALVLVCCAVSIARAAPQAAPQATPQAEAATAPEFVMPERPLFVVEFDGPALAWSRFLPTDLGRVLANDDAALLEHIVAEPVAAVRAMLGDALGDSARLDELQRAMLDYAGRVTIMGAGVDADDPQLTLFVRWTDDGSGIAERLGRLAGEFEERLPCATRACRGGHALLVGPNAAHTLADACSRRDAATNPSIDRGLDGAAFGVWIDAARLHEFTAGRWLGNEKWAALGLDGLRDLRVLARPAGARVEIEVSVGLAAERRGVIAGLFPLVEARSPTLVHLVPAGAENWGVTQKRWHLAAAAMIDAFDVRAMLRKSLSIHLDSDLLVHVGDEMLFLGEDVDELCVVMRLDDPPAFDAAWQKLSQAQSLADEAPQRYRDVDVFDISFGDVSHARLDDLFVVATGDAEDRHALVRQIIDLQSAWREAVAEGRESAAELAPGHEQFERLRPRGPAGACGRGRLQFRRFVGHLCANVRFALPSELHRPLIAALGRANDALTAADLELAHFHLISGSSEDRWAVRAFW